MWPGSAEAGVGQDGPPRTFSAPGRCGWCSGRDSSSDDDFAPGETSGDGELAAEKMIDWLLTDLKNTTNILNKRTLTAGFIWQEGPDVTFEPNSSIN